MICQNCGKSIPEDSKFCPYCAAPTVLGQPDFCATEESVNTSQAVDYKKRKKGIIPIFIVAALALGIFGLMAYGSDDSQVSATESVPPKASTTTSSGPDISSVKSSAKELAVEWAMENMQQYGKISGGSFSESTGPHSYTLRYDYRSPNAFNAKEEHVLFLIYTENNSEWGLHAATADGESLQVTNG